jgi:alpha-beta hydrolase superfamily lysophospholipase
MHSAKEFPNTVLARDGSRLSLRHWPVNDEAEPRGTICLVHGLGEHIGRYERLAGTLSSWGWSVVGYDMRGHGLSEGGRGVLAQSDDLLHDLAYVLDAIRQNDSNQQLVLLGHSLGGLVVARFVAALSEPIENSPWQRQVDLCVLSSPALALHLSIVQKVFLKTLGVCMPSFTLNNGLNPEWLCTEAEVVEAYRSDPLVHNRISGRLACFMIEAAKFVALRAASWRIPTLLLYSGQDRCVCPVGSEHFGSAAPRSLVETRVFEKLRHEIFNETETAGVYFELQSWLAK